VTLRNQFGIDAGPPGRKLLRRDLSDDLGSFGAGVLTPREREIAAYTLKGHSAESAGQILGISPGTVRIHRRNIYAKLQINSQGELFSRFLSTISEAS
jgi:DNA-binding CsgD family transcriptional regulator